MAPRSLVVGPVGGTGVTWFVDSCFLARMVVRTRRMPHGGGLTTSRWGARRRRQSDSAMVTVSMTTFSLGLPDDVPTASMAWTTSPPETTAPKRE